MSDDTQAADASTIELSLEQVRQRFEAYRQQRKKRTRIPKTFGRQQSRYRKSTRYAIYQKPCVSITPL